MEFFNNKENDTLKFKINSIGVTPELIDARLIFLTSENKNYLITGHINEEICEFDIPMLGLYEKDNSGKIVFEIVSGDTYFRVWEDSFSVKSKMSIVVENIIEEKKVEEKKAPLQVSLITEQKKIEKKPKIKLKPKIEVKEEKKKEDFKMPKTTEGFPTFGDLD